MRRAVLAIVLSVAVHGGIAIALASYLGSSPSRRNAPELEVSRIELSFADKVEECEDAVDAQSPSSANEACSERGVVAPPPIWKSEGVSLPKVAEAAAPKPSDVAALPEAAPRQAHVEAPARPRRTIRPDYPRRSRESGEEGDVTVSFRVDVDGSVSAVKIASSSGYAALDRAAIAAVRKARFMPAESDGVPIVSVASVMLSFRLKQ